MACQPVNNNCYQHCILLVPLVSICLLTHVDTVRIDQAHIIVLVQGIMETILPDNYYCESGSTGRPAHGTVYATNPLWDG